MSKIISTTTDSGKFQINKYFIFFNTLDYYIVKGTYFSNEISVDKLVSIHNNIVYYRQYALSVRFPIILKKNNLSISSYFFEINTELKENQLTQIDNIKELNTSIRLNIKNRRILSDSVIELDFESTPIGFEIINTKIKGYLK